jgi:hypothetical protein
MVLPHFFFVILRMLAIPLSKQRATLYPKVQVDLRHFSSESLCSSSERHLLCGVDSDDLLVEYGDGLRVLCGGDDSAIVKDGLNLINVNRLFVVRFFDWVAKHRGTHLNLDSTQPDPSHDTHQILESNHHSLTHPANASFFFFRAILLV